jgi:hypothetical protein
VHEGGDQHAIAMVPYRYHQYPVGRQYPKRESDRAKQTRYRKRPRGSSARHEAHQRMPCSQRKPIITPLVRASNRCLTRGTTKPVHLGSSKIPADAPAAKPSSSLGDLIALREHLRYELRKMKRESASYDHPYQGGIPKRNSYQPTPTRHLSRRERRLRCPALPLTSPVNNRLAMVAPPSIATTMIGIIRWTCAGLPGNPPGPTTIRVALHEVAKVTT